MQTLTSVQRCGWSGRISQFATVFFLFVVFFAKATGRTVRPIWTNEGLKRVVPLKGVPFGGSEQCVPKFWG